MRRIILLVPLIGVIVFHRVYQPVIKRRYETFEITDR
jgi:hypothetical protein